MGRRPGVQNLRSLPITGCMERDNLEAWADALLDQHRTAPKSTDRDPVARLDPMTRLMVEAGAAPMPDMSTYRSTPAADPDAWVGKAQIMAMVLVGVLVMSVVLALAAG